MHIRNNENYYQLWKDPSQQFYAKMQDITWVRLHSLGEIPMVRQLWFPLRYLFRFPPLWQTFIKLLLRIYSSPQKAEIHYKSLGTVYKLLFFFFNFLNLIHLTWWGKWRHHISAVLKTTLLIFLHRTSEIFPNILFLLPYTYSLYLEYPSLLRFATYFTLFILNGTQLKSYSFVKAFRPKVRNNHPSKALWMYLGHTMDLS